MAQRFSVPPLSGRLSQELVDLPRVTRLGLAIILLGLALDAYEHGIANHARDAVVAGFPIAEHAAHLVVLIGMVLFLAGIVVGGTIRARQFKERSDAIR